MIHIAGTLNMLWFCLGRQWAIYVNSIHPKRWVWQWWYFGWRNCLPWILAISQWMLCAITRFSYSLGEVLPSDVEVFLLCGWGPPLPLCDVNVWLLGPGSQGGQRESGIFKLHQMSAFAVNGAVFGQEIFPFGAGRNKVNTTCELTCTA